MITRLSPRERLFVASGLAAVVAVVLIFGVALPYRASLERMSDTLAIRQQQLQEVRLLQDEILALRQNLNRLERRLSREDNFAPLAFAEGLVAQVAERSKLAYMRPKPPIREGALQLEPLELKVERLSLEQVLRLLWEIERAQAPLRIGELQLKRRFDNPRQIDLALTLIAVRRVGS